MLVREAVTGLLRQAGQDAGGRELRYSRCGYGTGHRCVLRLDEQATTALYHLFGQWLGYEPVDN
ncbi:MAG: hypothetical protein ACRDRX_22915 [Pseudonocardiaceae bacterium]